MFMLILTVEVFANVTMTHVLSITLNKRLALNIGLRHVMSAALNTFTALTDLT